MRINELIRDAPNLKGVFENANKHKIRLALHEIISAELEIKKAFEDYALVTTHMPSGVKGCECEMIHPYGSKFGYVIGEKSLR